MVFKNRLSVILFGLVGNIKESIENTISPRKQNRVCVRRQLDGEPIFEIEKKKKPK